MILHFVRTSSTAENWVLVAGRSPPPREGSGLSVLLQLVPLKTVFAITLVGDGSVVMAKRHGQVNYLDLDIMMSLQRVVSRTGATIRVLF